MISSFLIAVGLFVARKSGVSISDPVALIASVAATTVVWVTVTLMTQPTEDTALRRFYELTRPAGPGWNAVRRASGLPASRDSFPNMLLGWSAGVAFVYAGLFGTGSLIYGRTIAASLWAVVFVASGVVLARIIPRLFSGEPGLAGSETSARADARPVRKAVILAAGRGTRMQATDATPLTPEQAAAARSGAKAAMPLAGGRPFLDYVLASLADAGFVEVCIIVGPNDDVIRPRYESSRILTRLRVSFVVQHTPIGTADALLASEEFAAGEQFVVMNSDNYYPVEGLRALRETDGPATLAFSRAGLLRDGQISADRLARYALLEVDRDGFLSNVIEKPADPSVVQREDALISMNVWRFGAEIFRACREVPPSPRGELELPMAVALAVRTLGMRIRALPIEAGVLDLSHRADVPAVAARLDALEVEL